MDTKEINTNLLPCPICGGEVIEGSFNWNMSHAECTKCDARWGVCGSQFKDKLSKWNQRVSNKETAIGFAGWVRNKYTPFGRISKNNTSLWHCKIENKTYNINELYDTYIKQLKDK